MASESSVLAVIRASRPTLRNDHDKVIFAIHACFLSAGFYLKAVGRRALADIPPTEGEEVGVEGWNELDDSYGFVYSKSEKGTKKAFLLKCVPMENYLMLEVVELTGDQRESYHLQINARDYLADDIGQQSNYGELYKNLQGLVKTLNTDVLEKFEPKSKIAASTSTSRPARNDKPSPDTIEGYTNPPSRNEPMPSGLVYPPVIPYGGSDLYPGPGAGFFPERDSGMGGSMLVGPNDPRFFGPSAQPGGFGGIPGVPPGARFDPIGPPKVPGFEPARFMRQPRRPGGGTHPDLEHFQGSDYI